MKLPSVFFSCLMGGLLLGCGAAEPDYGPLGTLSGKVTFNGGPLTEGTIILDREGGGSGAAPMQADGTFLVTDRIGGIPVGTYKVGFEAAQEEIAGTLDSPPQMKAKLILPEKYYNTSESGLTVEVKEGSNTLEFEVVP
ncbi:MAG TPA: hypothetical protein PLR25_15020 [Planctomycetaceae bacterium]|nr:hypothetical protein [Planctomycetaceae bacterium]